VTNTIISRYTKKILYAVIWLSHHQYKTLVKKNECNPGQPSASEPVVHELYADFSTQMVSFPSIPDSLKSNLQGPVGRNTHFKAVLSLRLQGCLLIDGNNKMEQLTEVILHYQTHNEDLLSSSYLLLAQQLFLPDHQHLDSLFWELGYLSLAIAIA